MSYINSNLIAGERVVYRTRLHWFVFLAPVLFILVVLLPIAWLLAQGSWQSFAWVPLALGLLVLLPAVVKRQSSDFAVTNKRVMMKSGVLTTRSVELLLGKIEAKPSTRAFSADSSATATSLSLAAAEPARRSRRSRVRSSFAAPSSR